MGYILQPPLLLALLWGRSFSSALLDQFRTRFQRDSASTFKHPVSLTFTPQNCGFHGLDFRVRWIPATISPSASILLSFRFITGQPPVAQSSFLASLMTIAAGVAVYNVFRRFCEPCFHWVATRELRLISLWNPPTGRWYMLKLGTC
jgi:hypothetical protein